MGVLLEIGLVCPLARQGLKGASAARGCFPAFLNVVLPEVLCICVFPVPAKRLVPVPVVVEEEVHVEAGLEGENRIRPLGDHGGVGVFPVQHGPDVPPDGGGAGLVVGIVLYQGVGHVHPEAVAAKSQPEAHDVLDGFDSRFCFRGIRGGLPFLSGGIPPVVQGRLGLKEIQHVAATALGLAADIGVASDALEGVARPDIAAAVLIGLGFLACNKPFVLLRGVAGNQVEEDMNPLLVRFFEEVDRVVIGSVAGRNQLVISHIVSRVFEGGVEAGVDPEGIRAQVLDVIELLDDSLQIPDAVPVRIVEGLGVDFVEYRVIEPGRHSYSPFKKTAAQKNLGG